ncbi:Plasmid replication initiator protein TrfA [Rhodocyclaceae bacterium]|nr:Plasmid replication initiator protein TrfA [Rhodocyclaceae bacterium]
MKATKTPVEVLPAGAVAEMPAQLPLWRDAVRGIPNAIARSALFSVNCSDPRTRFHRHEIAALQGSSITYTGEELRLDDEDVLLQLIHLARLQPLGQEVIFSSYAVIKALGWSVNTHSYERLYDSIERMKATAVTIKFQKPDGAWLEFKDSLISTVEHGGKNINNRTDSLWRVKFNRDLLELYSDMAYTELDWQMRRKLPPLAKKLHTLYMTSENPQGLTVEQLHKLTGSRIKQLKQFRYKLRNMLELMHERKFLADYVVDPTTDVVRVRRQLSGGHGATNTVAA